ncbi:MAG: bifunctional phosphoribosyl-AMP cyclohydrolase/phosphoribosyl-ATP diphosphatase HisIE [Gammaproteobacteria bacterium]|nr:bifunctional phosphoribosyl-AMP cyclohydrolase/phosphoribosyl-ATP diphosphatase HisIE [Gammaproteobacteria bacterium]
MTKTRTIADADQLAWEKSGGLLPAIVQHADSGTVLMLGYMNREALAATERTGLVTFWSRSRGRLWTKGETSGHVLALRGIAADCDRDALLVTAVPSGPVCHLGTPSCWAEDAERVAAPPLSFLCDLERIVGERWAARAEDSYTARLAAAGTRRIAQKVGEEGLEVALAGVAESDDALLGEAADLIYHLLVLLRARDRRLAEVVAVLEQRHALGGAKRGG